MNRRGSSEVDGAGLSGGMPNENGVMPKTIELIERAIGWIVE